MCDLGGSGYCLWGLETKMCEKSWGDNSEILGSGVKHYVANM